MESDIHAKFLSNLHAQESLAIVLFRTDLTPTTNYIRLPVAFCGLVYRMAEECSHHRYRLLVFICIDDLVPLVESLAGNHDPNQQTVKFVSVIASSHTRWLSTEPAFQEQQSTNYHSAHTSGGISKGSLPCPVPLWLRTAIAKAISAATMPKPNQSMGRPKTQEIHQCIG
jgi:hypothetical protein